MIPGFVESYLLSFQEKVKLSLVKQLDVYCSWRCSISRYSLSSFYTKAGLKGFDSSEDDMISVNIAFSANNIWSAKEAEKVAKSMICIFITGGMEIIFPFSKHI